MRVMPCCLDMFIGLVPFTCCATWQIDGRISIGCVILGESVNGYVFSILM